MACSRYLYRNNVATCVSLVMNICSILAEVSERNASAFSWKALPGDIANSSKLEGMLAKRSIHSDAVMTGILVTRFKMGLVDVEGLERMAANATSEARCLAARKVLEALKGLPELSDSNKKVVTMPPTTLKR